MSGPHVIDRPKRFIHAGRIALRCAAVPCGAVTYCNTPPQSIWYGDELQTDGRTDVGLLATSVYVASARDRHVAG